MKNQCRIHHEQSINGLIDFRCHHLIFCRFILEFRDVLELFERLSSSIGKIELNELTVQAEKNLDELKYQFDVTLYNLLKKANSEKTKNFGSLRPTLGQPSRKDDLERIDQEERVRQNNINSTVQQLRSTTIVNLFGSDSSLLN